jgi:Mg-chelatase subunit ChlD/DNA-binding transcriptional regulator YdaS (Cro superfamily)
MDRNEHVSRARRLAAFVALLAGTALAAHATSLGGPTERPPIAPPARATIEVVFVLDTTGSMSGLIEGAKRKIWSVANQMASGQPRPEVRIGLVAYRDRGDDYVTRVFDLSTDIDAVYARLQQLSAGGGGDTPESVNQALREAVERMSWSPGQDVYKVLFLVGDAPPHTDYPNDLQYAESVRAARERGIVVNAIQCGTLDATTLVWREIAAAGAGRYVAIRQDGGMLAMTTPHDEELASLNRALGDTVIAWGAADERAEIEAKRERALAAPEEDAASRLSFLAKAGGRVNSGRADLVDAVTEGSVDAKNLAPEVLPEPLRQLSPEAREAFVEEKSEQREQLKQQISEVSRKRDAWVEAEQRRRAEAGEADGFDQQVLDAIRSQAAAKGIAY